mgnify:CR=1 FL=1
MTLTDAPKRIQLRRTKGWRMPPNTVKVTRPGRWENPFCVTQYVAPGKKVAGWLIAVPTVEDAVECFRIMMHERPEYLEEARQELRGKNLGCWCKLGEPCHADVLLEIANA